VACAGIAGSYLSLSYSPMWVENMTAGRGWIALALVVFATWRPGRLMLGAYLFGAISILQLHGQAYGLQIPFIVLVLISLDQGKIRRHAPQCIGKSFYPTN